MLMMAIVLEKITNCISTRSTSSLAFGGGWMDGWRGGGGGGRGRWDVGEGNWGLFFKLLF